MSDYTCNCVGMLDIKGQETIRRVYSPDALSPTLTTMAGGNREPKILDTGFRVRKLTPLECWRLMGFSDDDFYRAKYGPDVPSDLAKRVEHRDLTKEEWKRLWRYARHEQMSNSQLYKQAGNSIVVNVLMAIFEEMM